jgi:hypothetical protein
MLLEVSGRKAGDLDDLRRYKEAQLRSNPYGKGGYVSVVDFSRLRARLWFCEPAHRMGMWKI